MGFFSFCRDVSVVQHPEISVIYCIDKMKDENHMIILMQKEHLTEFSIHSWYASAAAKSLKLCLTLCDPIDGSPLGSPVPGILQARTLEWVAISFSNA